MTSRRPSQKHPGSAGTCNLQPHDLRTPVIFSDPPSCICIADTQKQPLLAPASWATTALVKIATS